MRASCGRLCTGGRSAWGSRRVQLAHSNAPHHCSDTLHKQEVAAETPLGLMVQRKWDGDRLQAHVHPKGESAGRAVQLFTRNAKVRSL